MKITKKFLASLLNKHMNSSCTASHFYTTEYYLWYLILENNSPAYVIKYHREAKYFCEITSIDNWAGVNPIFMNDINEASLELGDILDENQLD